MMGWREMVTVLVHEAIKKSTNASRWRCAAAIASPAHAVPIFARKLWGVHSITPRGRIPARPQGWLLREAGQADYI
jgi:hypothetical protein